MIVACLLCLGAVVASVVMWRRAEYRLHHARMVGAQLLAENAAMRELVGRLGWQVACERMDSDTMRVTAMKQPVARC